MKLTDEQFKVLEEISKSLRYGESIILTKNTIEVNHDQKEDETIRLPDPNGYGKFIEYKSIYDLFK